MAPACKAFNKGTVREQLSDEPPPSRETVDGNEPVLKAHMDDGDVYVLKDWTVEGNAVVRGEGVKYDARRKVDNKGLYKIPIEDVSLFETNVLRPSGGIIAMTVITGLSLAWAGVCLTVPKTCFGSCPTFYAGSGSVADRRPMAEGFSHAVAPSLESTDIDALPGLTPTGDQTTIRMTNEAMETHVVRRVGLLAARTPDGQGDHVYRTTDGEYRLATRRWEPTACESREGDCRAALREADGTRYKTETDPENLAARETVDLTYRVPGRTRVGLALTFRQSFVTTFLFYRFLSDLGSRAVDFLARMERTETSAAESFSGITDLMGEIEVQIEADGEWKTVGRVGETGPLADDTRLVVLPDKVEGTTDVRLRMAQGNWRLDAARLVELGANADVQPLELTAVDYEGEHADAAPADPAAEIRSQSGRLVTTPGDAYEFRFALPEHPDRYQYFLKSRGYYLEWMRQKWLEDKNPAQALQMVMWPSRALRTLAPAFKEREPEIEETFWESRYVPSK